MKIEYIKTIWGPNVFTHKPVVSMLLRLEELSGRESREFEGFNDSLVELLPGLGGHVCGRGYAGGFIERIREGTYFGHIVEHAAIELMAMAGMEARYGKTVFAGAPDYYRIAVEFQSEHAASYFLESAVALVQSLLRKEMPALEPVLEEGRKRASDRDPGPSTRSILNAADDRGIPWFFVEGDLVQFGYGKHRKFMRASLSGETGVLAADIASDKDLTKRLLDQTGIPVPRGHVARTPEEAVEAFGRIDPPVVVKPLDSNHGNGVSIGVGSRQDLSRAYQIAKEYSSAVLIEEMFSGNNYRILVVGGKVVAASERIPPFVTGDGRRTIGELIELMNSHPDRGLYHDKPLSRIVVDAVLIESLRKKGLALESVIGEGNKLVLRDTVNLSTGAVARDVTDGVHPSIVRLCERAAKKIGLDICGVDLISRDISRPLGAGEGVIEVNAAPGLRMHAFPSEGKTRAVGKAIINHLFPVGYQARIPIFSVTGTNGKTTVARMLNHFLSAYGYKTGLACTDGIYLGPEQIAKGDCSGFCSARTILSDPETEAAVLETARGGLMRAGLGFDWCDVGVINNVQMDHLGQDGLETIDDLIHVKSLVAERVREGGALVVNADDENSLKILDRPLVKKVPKRIVFFSLSHENRALLRHLALKGAAFFIREGWIMEANGQEQTRIARVSDVPASFSGAARFQLANVLAALAAARAHGVPRQILRAALENYYDHVHNAGRCNLYQLGRGFILLDYAHNPHAFASVSEMAGPFASRRTLAVIAVPGDRTDDVIEVAGRIAARHFDRLIIREDADLRGRAPGETAGRLLDAVRREAPGKESVIILNETESLMSALAAAEEGDFVFFFYEKLEPAAEILRRNRALPVFRIAETFSVRQHDAAAKPVIE